MSESVNMEFELPVDFRAFDTVWLALSTQYSLLLSSLGQSVEMPYYCIVASFADI